MRTALDPDGNILPSALGWQAWPSGHPHFAGASIGPILCSASCRKIAFSRTAIEKPQPISAAHSLSDDSCWSALPKQRNETMITPNTQPAINPGNAHDNDNVAMRQAAQGTPRVRTTAIQAPRTTMELEGFAFVPKATVETAIGAVDITPLVEATRSAPADRYDATGSRFRWYRQGTYFPWSNRLVPNPAFQDAPELEPYSSYFQSSSFNIEQGNQQRRFAPFSDDVMASPALLALTELCFRLIPRWRLRGDGRWPVLVGMHLVRLQSDGRRAAVATPNHAHQDGEPFTFVILLERDNVVGGVSYIVQARCAGQHPDDLTRADVLASGTLTDPLDIAAIDDARVAHHVTGVLGADGRPGSRSALLLDFSELQPVRTPEPPKPTDR
jgi:hypothetical protein